MVNGVKPQKLIPAEIVIFFCHTDILATQGAEESCLTVMLAQFIAQIDLVIQNNKRD